MFSGEPRPAAGEIGEYPGIAPALPAAVPDVDWAESEAEAWAEAEDAAVAADAGAAVAAEAAMAAAAAGLPSIIIICGVGGVGSSLAFICNVLCTSMTA